MMRHRIHPTFAALLAMLLAAGCGRDDGAARPSSETAATGTPTYARDVAPILHDNCTVCHRPGEAAPFPFVTYDDARKRANQIVTVTGDGFMPPWLPAAGHGEFIDERRLTDEQLDILRRWAEAGAPEGDATTTPAPPQYTPGWQLGEPDLVIDLPYAYDLRADGPDVFRNFVIPIPTDAMRYVRAVEFRPGNAQVVHHAVMYVDRGRASRRLDAQDDELGFPGMEIKEAETPDGHFLGWTPGRMAREATPGTAWRLFKGTDLVVQLHLQPSGKVEPVDPKIGFYFTDEPPDREFFHITLRNDNIIIPPGQANHVVEDEWTLPVDVEVLGLYPHAHYIGKRIEAWAELPDGTRESLLLIPDWDFNWQDEFRYTAPIPLPAGTKLRVQFAFDNSAANVRNPNDPPRRVTFGLQSTDEMATLGIQVVAKDAEGLEQLRDGMRAKVWERMIDNFRRMAAEFPKNPEYPYGIGLACRQLGRLDEAKVELERALALDTGHLDARNELGVVEQLRRFHGQAIPQFEMVIAADPDHIPARYNLANSLFATGRYPEAVEQYKIVIAADPDHVSAHFNLALTYRSMRYFDSALEHLNETIAIRPDHAKAHYAAGQALKARRDLEGAERHFRQLVALNPDFVGGHFFLAMILMEQGELDEAQREFEETLRIQPDHPEAIRRLAQLTGEDYVAPAPRIEDIRGLPK